MTIQELASRLCQDMIVGVFTRGDRSFIATRFSYPVGDSVNLYLADDNSVVSVSDKGHTHYSLRVRGIDITESRRDFITGICTSYGVSFDGHQLTKRIDPDSPSSDIIQFCEAITRISTLEYDAKAYRRSRLADEVDTLVTAKIEPMRATTRKWTDEIYDPKRVHLVDYHMNTKGQPKNLFLVTSSQRAEVVTGIILFWQSRIPAEAMAIIDADLELPSPTTERLREASNQVRVGVAGNEQDIVSFALRQR